MQATYEATGPKFGTVQSAFAKTFEFVDHLASGNVGGIGSLRYRAACVMRAAQVDRTGKPQYARVTVLGCTAAATARRRTSWAENVVGDAFGAMCAPSMRSGSVSALLTPWNHPSLPNSLSGFAEHRHQ